MRRAITHTISSLTELRALCSHPMRNQVVELIALEPMTVTDIARRVKETPNRVYYHVTELEKAGLIRAVRTRTRGNLAEKLYQTVAPYIRVDERLFRRGAEGLELFHETIQTVLDTASLDLRKVDSNRALTGGDLERAIRSFNLLRLSPGDIERLGERLRKLLDEFKARERPDAPSRAALTIVFYPHPDSIPVPAEKKKNGKSR
jgi:DNA-binding transcriptional ArsR family regulator